MAGRKEYELLFKLQAALGGNFNTVFQSALNTTKQKVIKNPPFIPAKGAEQRTESESGGSGEAAFAAHSHAVKIAPWLPSPGDYVLCLYIPTDDGDGFVIGGI